MVARIVIAFVIACVTPLVGLSESLPPVPGTTYEVIDGFSRAEPERAWKPMAGSASASVVDIGGKKAVRMSCNFRGTRIDRASWDYDIKLDLTMCKGLQFLFFCRDVSPVAYFTMYLHSGDGWYRSQFDAPASDDWSVVTIQKNAAGIEGQPAGWGKIDTIRLSAWRGQDMDTEFYVAAMGTFGKGGKIVVVRGDSAANQTPEELDGIKQFASVVTGLLDRASLPYVVLSDLDVTSERLAGIKLVILPYNPSAPKTLVDELTRFLQAGGKLIVCYTLPEGLEPIVGIRVGPHVRQEYPGYFASIRPCDDVLEGMPAVTKQASWNIRDASAVEGRSRVAAQWFSDNGQSTGKAALIASDNCVFFTHVLLSDDASTTFQLLLAMIGNLVPDLWRDAARGSLDRVGRLGPYDGYDSAKAGMSEAASGEQRVSKALSAADGFRSESEKQLSKGKYSQAIVAAEKAQESLIDAYCMAQKSLSGEHRAFWCHSAFGVAGMSWDEAIRRLAENGFTAILPNMLWGGVAFYDSDVLPVAPAVREKGDQIALCLAACRKYGVEC
ncbi:MAG: hypothetical protein P8Z79_21695, partial [Sedimentisphaerales bacterium]